MERSNKKRSHYRNITNTQDRRENRQKGVEAVIKQHKKTTEEGMFRMEKSIRGSGTAKEKGNRQDGGGGMQ